jgi:squalene-hopene/tetraprenyl-beta-curcumene cyclase
MSASSSPVALLRSPEFARAKRASIDRLLAARGAGGHWTGELSSSALSTATAIAALRLIDNRLGTSVHASRIAAGEAWLAATQLADGSWGDTSASPGNLSTTLLCWSVLAAIAEERGLSSAMADRGAEWIATRAGGTDPAAIAGALLKIYGADKTFSVPILVHMALCGRLGDPHDPATWRPIPQLPFELATLPQAWFRLVDMQVVSYALPALIAIGQIRHARAPGWPPFATLRDLAVAPTLRTLRAIQPQGGGYLEATPLTSFVTMSLAGMDRAAHPVAIEGVAFLVASQRDDGSWPIDTNLATWCTTLSVGALAAGGKLSDHLDRGGRDAVRGWLLEQQWNRVHPYTGAEPGGWAWSDLPGGVPDADDTSGGLLALAALEAAESRPLPLPLRAAARRALTWLVNLANRDGGTPTFCRGWGRLPFDTSCPDITAHVLRAAEAWTALDVAGVMPRTKRALAAGRRYLAATQRADGAWWPLWFGNQAHPEQANPAYGTAKVVRATRDHRGAEWLMAVQGADGGIASAPGIRATIEETAVAVEALAEVAEHAADRELAARALLAVGRGLEWLITHTDGGKRFPAAPIGLYFAKLWYDEALYPLVFTVTAFERAARLLENPPSDHGG